MRIALVVVLTGSLLAACHKQEQRPLAPLPPSPDEQARTPPGEPPGEAGAPISDAELEARMREAIGFFVSIADTVDAAAGDCAKMAAGIERVYDAHADLRARLNAFGADPATGDRAETWMQAHEGEVAPTFQRLQAGVQPCASDPAVQAVMEKLNGDPSGE